MFLLCSSQLFLPPEITTAHISVYVSVKYEHGTYRTLDLDPKQHPFNTQLS